MECSISGQFQAALPRVTRPPVRPVGALAAVLSSAARPGGGGRRCAPAAARPTTMNTARRREAAAINCQRPGRRAAPSQRAAGRRGATQINLRQTYQTESGPGAPVCDREPARRARLSAHGQGEIYGPAGGSQTLLLSGITCIDLRGGRAAGPGAHGRTPTGLRSVLGV